MTLLYNIHFAYINFVFVYNIFFQLLRNTFFWFKKAKECHIKQLIMLFNFSTQVFSPISISLAKHSEVLPV